MLIMMLIMVIMVAVAGKEWRGRTHGEGKPRAAGEDIHDVGGGGALLDRKEHPDIGLGLGDPRRGGVGWASSDVATGLTVLDCGEA